jgi:hypothetical protein
LNSFKPILICASVLLLGACASTPREQPAKSTPPAKSISLEEINTAIETGVQLRNEKGEEMVCRRQAKTGSRLARETICMTRAEWTQVSEESQRATRKSMRSGRIPHGT